MSSARGSVCKTASSVRFLFSHPPRSPKDSQACRFVLHVIHRNPWGRPVTASSLSCYHTPGYRPAPLRDTLPGPGGVLSDRWHGSLTESVLPCCHIAGYRTQAKGKDNTNLDIKRQGLRTEGREKDDDTDKDNKDKPVMSSSSGSIFQRFKQAYKEHGKILIGVHLVTSSVWVGMFYYAASKGINVVPWLEYIGISETIIKPFRSPNVGNIAMMYLMYKLATPARYTVTLGGTNLVIRYMRRTGRLDPIPEGDRIRELYKEGKREIRKKGPLVIQKQRAKHHKPSK